MKPERHDYDALIACLADGVEVDWAALDESATNDEERRRYGNLRIVSKVAQLHRTLAFEDATAAADSQVLPGDAPASRPDGAWMWGHLQVQERIAGGSFGDVYIARDPQLDRAVALKLLRPSVQRPVGLLMEEGRTLARVRHPNVVTVYGADVRDGRAGLWMEFVEGQTLTAWMHVHGPMGAAEAAAVGIGVCQALAAVHAAGLIHGDVKAQNVMREDGGRIVLMDFGAGHAEGAGAPAGTPLYLAPEVLRSQPATSRSDIYSLGVLLFHLLTGSYPCLADDLDKLKAAHADGARVYLRDLRPDLPAPLVDVVERALDQDPARRFGSAGEMERTLTSTARPAPPVRAWWWNGTIGLALAAAVLLAFRLPGLFGSALPDGSAIAVLPFIEASGAADHLMAGVTTDVVRELQRFNVQVKRADIGREITTAGIGLTEQQLGAAAIVRGEARRLGTRTTLGVTVERLGGRPLWSHEYSVEEAGLPRLARTIARDAARALDLEPRDGAPALPPEPNYRAYDAYLRGRAESDRRTKDSLPRALKYFEQAIAFDPDYAEPYAGRADAYMAMGIPAFGSLSPLEARRLAKQSLLKAIEQNPDLVEAHTSLAFAAFVQDWDWPAAQQEFDRALSLNPQYAPAHHWYAEFLNEMGRFDEAMAEIRRAQALEPMSVLYSRDVGWHLFCQARYREAVDQLRETLRMDPDFPAAMTLLARSLAGLGQYREALAELERARPRISHSAYLGFRGPIEAAAGHRGEAERVLAELRALPTGEFVSPYYLALIHTALGQNAEALDELERSYLQQDSTLVTVNIDRRLEPLRHEPRFKALVLKMRFPQVVR
jgi:Tfp pilus assembly protein PilF/TolB-like protein